MPSESSTENSQKAKPELEEVLQPYIECCICYGTLHNAARFPISQLSVYVCIFQLYSMSSHILYGLHRSLGGHEQRKMSDVPHVCQRNHTELGASRSGEEFFASVPRSEKIELFFFI